MKCCAYVGIHTESAHEVSALQKVRQIKSVEEAFRVYGLYDIIAKLKTSSKSKLKKIIAEEINGIESVRGTSTMLLKSKGYMGEMMGFQIPSPIIVAASK